MGMSSYNVRTGNVAGGLSVDDSEPRIEKVCGVCGKEFLAWREYQSLCLPCWVNAGAEKAGIVKRLCSNCAILLEPPQDKPPLCAACREASLSERKKREAEEIKARTHAQTFSGIVSDREGYVYLVAAENGAVKIGRSLDPNKRLVGLQGDSPLRLHLLVAFPFQRGHNLEYDLHQMLAERRLRGEWFALRVEDLEAVAALFAQYSPVYARCWMEELEERLDAFATGLLLNILPVPSTSPPSVSDAIPQPDHNIRGADIMEDLSIDKREIVMQVLRHALPRLPRQHLECLFFNQLGFTQAETADALGVNQATVSRMLSSTLHVIQKSSKLLISA